MAPITVLKFGGELLDDADSLARAAANVARLAVRGPLVVVHGGGRAIDAELHVRGIAPRFVDGLRITDAATLDVVVSVLAGRANTALVAAIADAGGRAVGLTGADGALARCTRAEPMRSRDGAVVDLGLVGVPAASDVRLLRDLLTLGYIPVVCSIGIGAGGALLNVNADTLAAHLAGALGAHHLIIAGTTAGVLDEQGRTIPRLQTSAIDTMAASGAAHSGMIAKLMACRGAIDAGVTCVSIVEGVSGADSSSASGTAIVREAAARPAAHEELSA